jgi:hypothetical protein
MEPGGGVGQELVMVLARAEAASLETSTYAHFHGQRSQVGTLMYTTLNNKQCMLDEGGDGAAHFCKR